MEESDDPEIEQEAVSEWDKMEKQTMKQMVISGYKC